MHERSESLTTYLNYPSFQTRNQALREGQAPMTIDQGRVTVPKFAARKAEGRKISMLTAYDFPTAKLLDSAGVDGILVGDSLGTVVQGHPTTLPVTLDQMIYHAEMVARAVERALVVVDMPFPTFHLGLHEAIRSASRILKETRAKAVKLEGGTDRVEVIAGLVSAGIPVMAHCGLLPQSIHQVGGHRVQRDLERLLDDAQAVQRAGRSPSCWSACPPRSPPRLPRQCPFQPLESGLGRVATARSS